MVTHLRKYTEHHRTVQMNCMACELYAEEAIFERSIRTQETLEQEAGSMANSPNRLKVYTVVKNRYL